MTYYTAFKCNQYQRNAMTTTQKITGYTLMPESTLSQDHIANNITNSMENNCKLEAEFDGYSAPT